MNPYEMTYIIRPDLDEEQMRAAVNQVNQRLETAGGQIIASYPWHPPRRRLAYPIREFGDGYYVTTVFNLDPEAVRPLENVLRLNENLLRFLLVSATEQNIRQAQHRMHQQQAAATAAAAPAPQPAAATPEGTPVPAPAAETPPQPQPEVVNEEVTTVVEE